MVAANFLTAYEFMQVDEKGRSDDPVDPGGRTCDGITQDEYAAWCRIHKQPTYDVWDITEETKRAIFYVQYWLPWCDRLPTPIDYLWFDVNVNSGSREATLILQRSLGFNKRQTDGIIGIHTVQACIEAKDISTLIADFGKQHRALFSLLVKEKPVMLKFEKGWMNRVDHEMVNAHALLISAGASS